MVAKHTVGHNSPYFIQQGSIYHSPSAWHLQLIQQQRQRLPPSVEAFINTMNLYLHNSTRDKGQIGMC